MEQLDKAINILKNPLAESNKVKSYNHIGNKGGIMTKIDIKGIKSLNLLVATALILAVVSGCVGTQVPQVKLDITAKAASGLIITHNGGDKMMLKDVKITVKREINDKVVDGLNAVPLFGNNPEFQDAPVLETLTAGQKIRHVWKESLLVGDVLVITIQDAPSGNLIAGTKVTVT